MTQPRFARLARILPVCGLALLSGCSSFPLFDTRGPIGEREITIIVIAFCVMMIVVLPVFVMTFLFAWRYRASNLKAIYAPHWGRSFKIDLMMWLVPAVIVAALGGLEWQATHTLNPYRPLTSTADPVEIDAVALNWKWLFIYPAEHVATVNQLVFPARVPVSFRLTSATVMTSFFIPNLGSQIYAMPGMRTKLNLLANRPGIYTGRNYQYSGNGFSWMQFEVRVASRRQFRVWLAAVRRSPHTLDAAALRQLERPSINAPVAYYSSIPPHLFAYFIALFHGRPTLPSTLVRNGER